MNLIHRANLEVFADYHQFYVSDAGIDPPAPEQWSDLDVSNAVKVAENIVVVCPIRAMTVPVSLEVLDASPSFELGAADHLVHCSLALPTGRLQVLECTGPQHLAITVPSGVYEVLVRFTGLATLSADGLQGNDHYAVTLWPGQPQPLTVLRQWPGNWGG